MIVDKIAKAISSGKKIAFNDDGSSTYDISLRMDNSITINDLLTFLETNEGIRDIRCELGT